jgi:putative chitinase
MKLTSALLMAGTGCSSTDAGTWLAPMQAACDKFGIDTPEGVASFLANVGVESSSLRVLVENLNYSATGLANTWPNRYAVDPHVSHKIPNATAYMIERQPVVIANNVYANRMGNGPESSGDGWKYRGQGPIQLTGHDNILKFFAAVGLPLTSDPAVLQEPQQGAMSAAFFYTTLSNALACSAKSFDDTVKAVNGQGPCAANQGDLRRKLYEAALPLAQALVVKPAPTPKKTTAAVTDQDKP